ncbi:hypothetical protein A2223_02160 [Candidatus Falkowbacteria bacterium RIFOXYA2_FULL_35_8]|uniref:Glycosyltransferase 2-like domain-containing protein n=1 Tax=Candidatus Falkowbacteria bacterium RIFOXYC2_FULL_36_12 TaxID=1798002 RepID=A0A1F5SWQ8_9BACT|nr:MAG: hypothetical protein A2478_00665 [Candidatus Falkowbacteria bacterium RIFOXYC2_FULL_36_12]OGF33016.1 MAG: hypothetical protein A2223_02160 [Candidatus Falkowbacteria bacterium RIFOXYA2_FULL_35_8]
MQKEKLEKKNKKFKMRKLKNGFTSINNNFMKISIVILNYKSKRLVGNCIRQIRASKIEVPYEIIVVDNDSNDGIVQMMAEEFKGIKFILATKNLGMGPGNNLGIKASEGEYVIILNPDIYVAEETIQRMYDYIKDKPEIGFLAPRLLNPDGSLQYTCYRWYKFLTPLYRRTVLGKIKSIQKELDYFLMKDVDHEKIQEVDWCQGSCFLVPKRIWQQVGGFDERFFMYFEDTDLCRRIRNKDFKVIYHGEITAIHMHMKMSQGGIFQIFSNKLTRQHIHSWLKYSLKHRKSLFSI